MWKTEIKNFIDKIDILAYIAQYVDLKPSGNEYVGLSPFTNEKTPSFFVNPNKKLWYCFSCGDGGDIVKFIEKYHHLSYSKALKSLEQWSGITVGNESEFAKIVNRYKKLKEDPPPQRAILDNNIMDKYKNITIRSWVEEGIKPEVLEKYQVRYDDNACRIVFPVWDIHGNLINIKGRAANPHWKEFGMAKYIYYYPLGKNDIFWGFHWHLQDIKEKQEIILVEGEKSVMKLESNGLTNVVALGTSHISRDQFKILLSLRVNVVLALDKDKNPYEDKNFIKLSRYTKCYAMIDTEDLLADKESPIDKGIEVFNKLYKERKLVK